MQRNSFYNVSLKIQEILFSKKMISNFIINKRKNKIYASKYYVSRGVNMRKNQQVCYSILNLPFLCNG